LVRVALALVGVFVLAGAVVFWLAAGAGSSPVEAWVATQIQGVADAYLNPKLSFTDLDYRFPATIRLKSLRLTADDPANPGKTIDIVACDRAEIELTEMPRQGQPIQIASIVLRKPLFQAVAMGDGTKRLVGFSDLIRKTAIASATDQAASSSPPPVASAARTEPAPDDKQTPTTDPIVSVVAPNIPRLSEFLRMKRVEIVDGQIVSDARIAGVPRVQIDKINTKLAVEPARDGWYKLDTHITRKPILDLSITGNLNLDTFTAADAVVTVKAQVARDHDSFLPPELQTFLREHEVQGALEAKITAKTLPLLDPTHGQMKVEASLAKANFSYRDYRVPVDSLVIAAALEEGVLKLSKMELKALRGEAEAEGSVTFNATRDTALRMVVRHMVLDDTIRDGTATAREPKFGGRVNMQFAAAAGMRELASTQSITRTWGRGKIDVDQGRLVHIPVVQGLGRAITKSTSWITGHGGAPGKGKGTDRASVTFALVGNQAHCSEMTYVGDVFAARGHGVVELDQSLDLIVNAGPLEKMQNLMGSRIGGIFGKLTDALAGYHVTGTVKDPDIGVQLAGGRVNRAGRAVKGGIGRVRSGIGSIGERIVGTDQDEQ
jgi:hypothetical protein